MLDSGGPVDQEGGSLGNDCSEFDSTASRGLESCGCQEDGISRAECGPCRSYCRICTERQWFGDTERIAKGELQENEGKLAGLLAHELGLSESALA